ncbi:MAG: hypothetical protein R2746_11760 [Acidimicrobiales bacterium]
MLRLRPNPDRLDDRAFVARRSSLRAPAGRPRRTAGPGDFGSAEGRADVLDQANAMVATMVDDLEADAPTTGDDAVRMEGWIADWRTYLADRDYALCLREDPDAKLLISVNENSRTRWTRPSRSSPTTSTRCLRAPRPATWAERPRSLPRQHPPATASPRRPGDGCCRPPAG